MRSWLGRSWLRRDVEHQLYRCWDGEGLLAYIGVTNCYSQRMYHHRVRTPWWDEVVKITTTPYPDRASALEAETAAIAAEHPIRNHQRTKGAES